VAGPPSAALCRVYVDLQLLILAKRRGDARYAVGAFNTWCLLDRRTCPPDSRVLQGVMVFAAQVGPRSVFQKLETPFIRSYSLEGYR
jgi:hypothetical protein